LCPFTTFNGLRGSFKEYAVDAAQAVRLLVAFGTAIVRIRLSLVSPPKDVSAANSLTVRSVCVEGLAIVSIYSLTGAFGLDISSRFTALAASLVDQEAKRSAQTALSRSIVPSIRKPPVF
jgi:hypothetical protein